ncbi:hypothetical protein HOT57_gp95 [Pseudomonas phage phCDa]|uniref:Uncharacterized protein n=1 Tax=Pseudomonas phage phCDa TaxID=2268587 RepID=A0A2Z5H9B6_9CAUD|nr:hypothetical protein HOT57_gp95 [Pseudomonas phage phCDa]AXC36539.1 hypothetical protein phCDa_95 [Pseudomonas phage phCDa]
MQYNTNVRDTDGNVLHQDHLYRINNTGGLINYGLMQENTVVAKNDEEAEQMARDFPAYWKKLPEHWTAIDTYRVNRLFPVDDPSGQLLHSRKKLLVPGCRTGGKTVYQDIKEAHRTLGAWLAEHPEHSA